MRCLWEPFTLVPLIVSLALTIWLGPGGMGFLVGYTIATLLVCRK